MFFLVVTDQREMVHHLSKWESGVLRSLYLNPVLPFQMRFWSWYWRLRGHRRFVVPYFKRSWIGLDPRDLVQQAIFSDGAYEPEVWETLQRFLRGGDIVWDIGAHIGSFGIRAAQDSRVDSVHCFEPLTQTYELLEANRKLNPSLPLSTHHCALSDRIQTQVLNMGEVGNIGRTRFGTGIDSSGSESVQCLTVDHLVFDKGIKPPTIVKLDVEGHEISVLKGAVRLLAEFPPRALVFEAPSDTLKNGSSEIIELLKQFGYQIELISRPNGLQDAFENFLARHS